MPTITPEFSDICAAMGEYGDMLFDEAHHSDRPMDDWLKAFQGIIGTQHSVKPAAFPDWVLANE